MKNRELIKRLQEFPLDIDVLVPDQWWETLEEPALDVAIDHPRIKFQPPGRTCQYREWHWESQHDQDPVSGKKVLVIYA